MEVFLLDSSGEVVNFVLADSVAAAQAAHPQYTAMQAVIGYGMGWTYSGGVWTEPPPPIPNPVMAKLDFLNLFGLPTIAAIQTAAASDAVISAGLTMLNAATAVNVTDPDTIYFVNYLASKSLITAAQQTAILGA